MYVACCGHVRLEVERRSEDSDDTAQTRKSGETQRQQPASSTFPTNKRVENGNGNQHGGVCRNASTGNLGGHADVAGSSAVLPLRSISSSGALHTRMRSQPTTTAEHGGGDENASSEGDLLSSLLRAAGTTAASGGADSSGLALRRRRRSNATDMDVVIRERTSSPVCVGVVGDLGQRTAGRRRSLPTPRLNVRDVVIPSCTARPLSGAEDIPESNTSCELPPVSSTAAVSTTAGVRQDECLSDIEENVTTSSTSGVPDISLTTNDSTTDCVIDSGETSVADNSHVEYISLNQDQKVVESTVGRQKLVENTLISSGATEPKIVDGVQNDVTNVTGGNSTDSVLRQTRSTVDVDVTETWSSKWLPRRSQSLRLYRLRDRSAARGELESQQIETNVQEFQTRAAPEREALRNRLRKLSQIYSASTDSDETSRTWPASRRPCADGDDGHATPTTAPGIPLRHGEGIVSASSSTSTLQLKYDTDSLSSQKDEGFETASISSDVYLSSSQRSSMCDCDAALMTVSTLERRTDLPTITKTTDVTAEPQSEMLPPPPDSFLNGPEVDEADGASDEHSFSRKTECVVTPRNEMESPAYDAKQHPSSNTTMSVINTASIEEMRLSNVNTESSRDASSGSVKTAASVSKKTDGTRQAKTAARTAPVTPCRSSSLVPSSTTRNVRSTKAAAVATNNQAAGGTLHAVKPSVRSSSGAVATTSTSGRHAAFQRSSPLRATDDQKSTLCSRGPAASSSAFVRQSQTRATIAAPVLRTNKRAAAEARKLKAVTASTKTAPTSVTHGSEVNTESSRDGLSASKNVAGVRQTAQTVCTRQTKATAKTAPAPPCRSTSSRLTTTTTSTSGSSVVPRPQRVRNRTSSSGSCSSTTSSGAVPKLASFRAANSGTTTRPPAASVNLPCASSKKLDGGAASSSSLKMPSNIRHSTQPPNSRLRVSLATNKRCS